MYRHRSLRANRAREPKLAANHSTAAKPSQGHNSETSLGSLHHFRLEKANLRCTYTFQKPWYDKWRVWGISNLAERSCLQNLPTRTTTVRHAHEVHSYILIMTSTTQRRTHYFVGSAISSRLEPRQKTTALTLRMPMKWIACPTHANFWHLER